MAIQSKIQCVFDEVRNCESQLNWDATQYEDDEHI